MLRPCITRKTRGPCCSKTSNSLGGCLCDGDELPCQGDSWQTALSWQVHGNENAQWVKSVGRCEANRTKPTKNRPCLEIGLKDGLSLKARNRLAGATKGLEPHHGQNDPLDRPVSCSSMMWLLEVAHLDVGANSSSGSTSRRDLTVRRCAYGHHVHKQPGRPEPRSSRRCVPEATGSFNQTDHLRCRVDGKRVSSETRPWQDESGHLAGQGELPIRRICQQGNHQVFQGDHAHMQLPQFGIGQRQGVARPPLSRSAP